MPRARTWRWASAIGAAALWGYWWLEIGHLSPRAALLVWASSIALWALALYAPVSLRRPDRVTWWGAGVVTLALIPRLVNIADVPYKITPDEVTYPLHGLAVLTAHPWEIFSGMDNVPTGLQFYLSEALQAWPCLFLGPLLGGRVASVLFAVGSLLATYALARRLFGAAAAAVAVLLLGCSYWHMVFSRVAYPYIQPMCVVPLALLVVLRGTSEGNRLVQFLGGGLLGCSLLIYDPARIVLPVFALWFAHRALVGGLPRGRVLAEAAVILLGIVLFLTPYFHAQGAARALLRYRQTTMQGNNPLHLLSERGWRDPEPWRTLGLHLEAAARAYYHGAGWFAVDDISPGPFVDPVFLALTLAGLVLALARLGDSNRFLLIAWVGATLVLGQVLTDAPSSGYRAAPLLPALAIAAGLAASRLWARIPAAWRTPKSGGVALGLLTAAVVPANLGYLNDYVAAHRADVGSGLARFIASASPAPVYYIVAGWPTASSPILTFLDSAHTVRDLPNLMDALSTPGAIETRRDAVFLPMPDMFDAAAEVIRRCYPGALTISLPYPAGAEPPLALGVSQLELSAAPHACAPPTRGLRARCLTRDGTVLRERVENWLLLQEPTGRGPQCASVEWSGWLTLPVAGGYAFQLLLDSAAGSATIGSQVTLTRQEIATAHYDAGRYPIRLLCEPHVRGVCWLRWAPPGRSFESIPPQFLQPTETPSPTG